MEQPRDHDSDKLASELEQDADDMQQRSEELDEDIDKTRKQWQSKRDDPSEAGAKPPEDDYSS